MKGIKVYKINRTTNIILLIISFTCTKNQQAQMSLVNKNLNKKS